MRTHHNASFAIAMLGMTLISGCTTPVDTDSIGSGNQTFVATSYTNLTAGACTGSAPEPAGYLCAGPKTEGEGSVLVDQSYDKATFHANWDSSLGEPQRLRLHLFKDGGGTWLYEPAALSPLEAPLPPLVVGSYRLNVMPADPSARFALSVEWSIEGVE